MDGKVKKALLDDAIQCLPMPESNCSEIFLRLVRIIEQRQLVPYFQPIISMVTGEIFAYEGLIRGPSNSSLHFPLSLFKAAGQYGFLLVVDKSISLQELSNRCCCWATSLI